MINWLKNKAYPIGLDMTEDAIKLVQLAENSKGISLIAAAMKTRPDNILPESTQWQTWAADNIAAMIQNGKFQGRTIVAAMPANHVIIDYMKITGNNNNNIDDFVLSEIKHKLSFDPDKTIIKYVTTENNTALVVASNKEIINKYLQIFESANLNINAINIWPAALTNCYSKLFGRRKNDIDSTVMLLDIEQTCSNIVICRSKKLLFARSIAIGAETLDNNAAISKLISELANCRRYFCSLQKNAQIERLIFLSRQPSSDIREDYYTTIAKQLNLPAQLGDCLAAMQIDNFYELNIDRRERQNSWATAFGLSFSQGD